jgi:hypothetical protein
MTTGNVAFTRDTQAYFEAGNFIAHGDYFADKLMAYCHAYGDGFLRPSVPIIDMNVGATNGGLCDFNQHLIVAILGYCNLIHP